MTRAVSSQPSRPAPARGRARGSRRSGVGGTLVGLFVGIALGLGLAAAVAFYVMRAGNPYQPAVTGSAREPGKEASKGNRAEPAGTDKPRFDFYKILPGVEEPKVQVKAPERPAADRAAADHAAATDKTIGKIEERPAAAPDRAAEPVPRAPKATERLWLQAGSFSTEGDAENMKAQLALSGIEAKLQQATLPDKSVRFRVRVGPYDNIDEAARVKSDLAKRGFDATVIK
jgi:cell division protein FtsN